MVLGGSWRYCLPAPCKPTKSRLADAEITKGHRSILWWISESAQRPYFGGVPAKQHWNPFVWLIVLGSRVDLELGYCERSVFNPKNYTNPQPCQWTLVIKDNELNLDAFKRKHLTSDKICAAFFSKDSCNKPRSSFRVATTFFSHLIWYRQHLSQAIKHFFE